MSKTKNAKEILRQINETRAQIAELRENEARRPSQFVQLVESELENYELILAAKAITDKLQDMAEKAASIEVDDVMPIIDGMKAAFGPEAAEQFNNAATESLRTLVEALKGAKDQIGNQILRLENGDTGEPMNDMGMSDDLGMDDAAGLGDLDTELDPEAGLGDDLGADLDPEAGLDAELDPEADLDLGDPAAEDNAAGRARKESVDNLDRAILESFRAAMAEGNKGRQAAKIVAEAYSVDVSDVVEIVKGAKA